jgi:hypothetical protein
VKGHLGLIEDEEESSATNFAELVAKLIDILTTKSTTKTKETAKNCVIALSNAEILRQLDSFLLPGRAGSSNCKLYRFDHKKDLHFSH